MPWAWGEGISTDPELMQPPDVVRILGGRYLAPGWSVANLNHNRLPGQQGKGRNYLMSLMQGIPGVSGNTGSNITHGFHALPED